MVSRETSTWSDADVPEAKADALHAIYERIVVTGRTIVSIRLSPSAYAHGLAVARARRSDRSTSGCCRARPSANQVTNKRVESGDRRNDESGDRRAVIRMPQAWHEGYLTVG